MSVVEPKAGRPYRRFPRSRIAAALLLASVAIPCQGAAAAAQGTQTADSDPNREIVITAQALYRGIRPERDLDPEGIASYGVSTIDELLDEVGAELGDSGEPPLILVNGERITDASEIGALPVEALRNVQVLPLGSAIRSGGTSTQRVVSLTLQRKVKSATLTAATKAATDGGWHSSRGEAIVTRINGPTTFNVTLRGRDDSALLESRRHIIQPDTSLPYAIGGIVVGFPNSLGEIDPLLSAAAGQTVTVAPVPATANPTLGNIAAGANRPAITDVGDFRTLRPRSQIYDLNATFSTRLTQWLTSRLSVRLARNLSRSKRGLPSGLFLLSAGNVFSPFSTDVGLAAYGHTPLESRSKRDTGDANATLNARFGRWTASLNLRHSISHDETLTDGQAIFGTIALDDSYNPFTGDLSDLLAIRTSKATGRSRNDVAVINLAGSAAKLPAGDVQATVEARLAGTAFQSRSSFSLPGGARRIHRTEQSIRAALDVPLTSVSGDFLPQIGDLSATAEYGLSHFSNAGTFSFHSVGLNWSPRPVVEFRGEISTIAIPAAIQSLGGPAIVTPQVRVFDPLTSSTVDVVQITGGNSALRPEKTDVRRISGLVRLIPRLNLQLNGEYVDTGTRNYISSLPEASAAVMLAFPDRFIRDSSGKLTTIDLRPVNFASHREKQFRYGFSLSTTLSGGVKSTAHIANSAAADDDEAASRPSPATLPRHRPLIRLQLTANHSIVFSDEIKIRSGLDSVDLLGGGAIGIAGGRVRHQLDGSASVSSGGSGVRIGVTWRGPSTLESRFGGVTDTLRFSPVLAVNLRAFADVHRFVPHADWSKRMRLSLNLLNATNDRQEVRDSAGNTPRQYQPGYRDPIGRTIEIELRKVF